MNNIFVSWKQKIESRIISDLKSQYTESEEQIRQRKEQFLKKQKKIILIEIIAGAVYKLSPFSCHPFLKIAALLLILDQMNFDSVKYHLAKRLLL